MKQRRMSPWYAAGLTVCISAALFVSAAAHATGNVLQGSTELHDIQMTLIDLDPDDGITPFYTLDEFWPFTGATTYASFYHPSGPSSWRSEPSSEGVTFFNGAFTTVGRSFEQNGVHGGISVSNGHLETQAKIEGMTGGIRSQAATYYEEYLLSPHSALRLQANVNASLSNACPVPGTYCMAQAYANLYLFSDSANPRDASNSHFSVEAKEGETKTGEQVLYIEIINRYDEPIHVTAGYGTNVDLSVPEPAHWALMLAGAMTVLTLKRRPIRVSPHSA